MPAVLPLPALRQLVESLVAQPHLWTPAVHFDPVRRFYAKLPSEPGVDVWLLTWLPDQSTELHDHGGSSAAVALVHGELSERRADPRGRVTRHRRLPGRTLGLAPGVVHDLEHAGDRSAVSIHAYSPPLTHMRFYEPTGTGLDLVRTELVDAPEPWASPAVAAVGA